jgi:hypothetical protein
MNIQPKTNSQIGRIFGLAKQRGIDFDKETQADFAADVSNNRVDRLSLLSFDEANTLIKNLGGDPLGRKPRRTENYHKQAAGVVTMATPQHLAKMDELAAKRGISTEGLERMCTRMKFGKRPRTAQACNAVIEALKSMIQRDNARRAA